MTSRSSCHREDPLTSKAWELEEFLAFVTESRHADLA
jgi:hypothetical protein